MYIEQGENSIYVLCCCVLHVQKLRVDAYISGLPLQLSRAQIRRCCCKVLLNGKIVKFSHTVQHKDLLELHFTVPLFPSILKESHKEMNERSNPFSKDKTVSIDYLYEDEMLIIINKAKGQLVHPGLGHKDHISIAEIVSEKLLSYRQEDTLQARAGIVHRLDKDTSGILLIAKTAQAHDILSRQFQERIVKKQYLAIVKGAPPKERDTVTFNIDRNKFHRKRFCVVLQGGKHTSTTYELLFTNGMYSLLLLRPLTGRTHQLRVLAQYLACPILGDGLYARKSHDFPHATLMLHAWSLSFFHPQKIIPAFEKHVFGTASKCSSEVLSTVSDTITQKEQQDNKNRYRFEDTIQDIISQYNLTLHTYTSPIPQDMQDMFVSIGYNANL